jgi:hypothetical protein
VVDEASDELLDVVRCRIEVLKCFPFDISPVRRDVEVRLEFARRAL